MTTYSNPPQIIALSSGYALSYQLFGITDGFPVLYCHGLPGSRLEARLADQAAKDLELSIIAVDRPGFGQSDFQPNRKMSDWVDDIRELMEKLGYKQFSVIGISGGSPYAMLLGEHMHTSIYRLGLVAGLGDLSQANYRENIESGLRAFINVTGKIPKFSYLFNSTITYCLMRALPKFTLKLALSQGPQIDRDTLSKPSTQRVILESFLEAIKQGGQGAAWDFYLATNQWQAAPENVKTETYLWHGKLDTTVPPVMAYDHAKRIPHCQAQFLDNEGHFSLPIVHMHSILATLAPQT